MRPSQDIVDSIAEATAAIGAASPIPSAHKGKLPANIRELSHMLTDERGSLERPYWSSPGLSAAYLYFFLPWNLYRLAWLLPNLELGLQPGSRILDLGSGPLTLPLALWCARPELRSMPLHFTCSDLALQPMALGRSILSILGKDKLPWQISLVKAPLDKALSFPKTQPFDCITAGNVLNELADERSERGRSTLADRIGKVMHRASGCLAPEGKILLVEPGTRLGGKLVAEAREAAMDAGLKPLAPCPHDRNCPMLSHESGKRGFRDSPAYSGWCHFSFPVVDAPAGLVELGRKAQLEKHALALSCLLLAAETTEEAAGKQAISESGAQSIPFGDELAELEALYEEIMSETPENSNKPATAGFSDRSSSGGVSSPAQMERQDLGAMPVRVISGPIHINGLDEAARYSCCEKGLALVTEASRLHSGSLVLAEVPKKQSGISPTSRVPERDAKSGAIFLSVAAPGKEKRQQIPDRKRPQRRARGRK